MKVKRLTMQAFRGIGDLTLEFDENEPTVLIGINGVGKSSVLDCLAILLSHLIQEIAYHSERDYEYDYVELEIRENTRYKEKYYPTRNFSEEDIKKQFQKTRNQITISLLNKQLTWSVTNSRKGDITIRPDINNLVDALYNEDDSIEEDNDYEDDSIEEDNDYEDDFIEEDNDYEDDSIEENNDYVEGDKPINYPLAVLYPVNRAVLNIDLKIEKPHSFKQKDAYNNSLNGARINFTTFFQWFRTLEDLENEEMRDNLEYRNHQLEAVRYSIYSLIPEFSNLRVRRSPLRMTVQKQGEELIVNQLSDGEKCLLAMVGDLARRLAIANPSLPDPLQGNGVVLIDEIELHLHPKWQREIIPALTRTFPNCQFIVTTHSPQVISHVKPEGVYILEKTDEGVVAKRPESSYGRDSNRILEDLMDVPARPQEIKDSLYELFRLIDQGNLDDAKLLAQQIAEIIGEDEGELVKARVSIRRKEILKR